MTVDEIRVGQRYWVVVPDVLPVDHPNRYLEGCRFDGVARALLAAAGGAGRVEVEQVPCESGMCFVALTEEQVARLSLPPGEYHVEGWVFDRNSTPVATRTVPAVNTFVVPVTWLRPLSQ